MQAKNSTDLQSNGLKVIYLKIDDLLHADYNPRKLSEKQLDDLKTSILNFGCVDPVIVNEHSTRKNTIVGGHQRVKACKSLGMGTVPCVFVSLPIEKERELNVRLNKNTGEFDYDILFDEFEKDDLLNWGFDLSDFDEDDVAPVATAGDDEVPETKDEPLTVKGDLYELGGRHRVLCGDSTMIDDVDKLMNGEKADLMISDLPYGVSYADKNTFLNHIDKGDRIQEEIKNDHISPEVLYDLAKAIYITAYPIMNTINSYYSFMPQGGEQMMMMMIALKDSGFQVKHELIWLKNNHVLGRADYNYKHEPICYGWTKTGTHKFHAKDFKVSILEFDRPHSSKLHPTMKPLDLLSELINNSSNKHQVIYDPTLGSGSTLIACEKTARKCYGLELDEKYCDVIVKRYVNFCKKNNTPYTVKRNGINCLEFDND